MGRPGDVGELLRLHHGLALGESLDLSHVTQGRAPTILRV